MPLSFLQEQLHHAFSAFMKRDSSFLIGISAFWAMFEPFKAQLSGASVRQRTIPTERPPLVGEVSPNFS
jgi:hypothetical protein